MNILGISGGVRPGNQDGAAVLVLDGQIIAAAEEERFVRIKHAPGMLPENAIRFCLKKENLRIEDIDLVVFSGRTYKGMRGILKSYFRFKFGKIPEIELIDHHFAHACSAYLLSGFKKSFIITADLSGDSRSTVLFYAEDGRFKEVESYYKPNSLGIFYSLITQYLGFSYDSDECKVMALAGYGYPAMNLDWFLKIRNDGYRLNTKYLDFRVMPGRSNPSRQEPLFNCSFVRKLKRDPRGKGEKIDKFYIELASSAQSKLENVYFKLLERLQSEFKCFKLCIAGGVALNAELNCKLIYSGKLQQLFVQPVAGDAGLALGAALYHSFRKGELRHQRLEHLYLGPEYKESEIRKLLDKLGINYLYCEQMEGKIAQELAKGKIVAVFWGRMEYGPRALGNRSILADPRDKTVKNKINKWVKQRESFQPFAPSVIEEETKRFFEFPNTVGDFGFMVINVKVRREMRKLIPAVVHVNSTSRIQLVNKRVSPRFYKVIQLFGEYTGIPVLLNTSMNIKGQPIARTPLDAIMVFCSTSIDCLAIENLWIEKRG